MKNYYEVLEVKNFADSEVIKASYKALCKKYHPDLHPNADESMMKLINEAYDVLADETRKKEYDQQLQSYLNSLQKEPHASETYSPNNTYQKKNPLSLGIRSILGIIAMIILAIIGGWVLAMFLEYDGSWSYLITYTLYAVALGSLIHSISGNESSIYAWIITLIGIIGLCIPHYVVFEDYIRIGGFYESSLELFILTIKEVVNFFLFSGWIRLFGVLMYITGLFMSIKGEA